MGGTIHTTPAPVVKEEPQPSTEPNTEAPKTNFLDNIGKKEEPATSEQDNSDTKSE